MHLTIYRVSAATFNVSSRFEASDQPTVLREGVLVENNRTAGARSSAIWKVHMKPSKLKNTKKPPKVLWVSFRAMNRFSADTAKWKIV
jgi:hypothetical protein